MNNLIFDDKILKDALYTWGLTAQLGMVQEECAELIVAINKYFREDDNAEENVVKELADCLIMCYQLVYYLGEDTVQYHIDNKMKRLKIKLEKEDYFETSNL